MSTLIQGSILRRDEFNKPNMPQSIGQEILKCILNISIILAVRYIWKHSKEKPWIQFPFYEDIFKM